jgi:hypothetical protein
LNFRTFHYSDSYALPAVVQLTDAQRFTALGLNHVHGSNTMNDGDGSLQVPKILNKVTGMAVALDAKAIMYEIPGYFLL